VSRGIAVAQRAVARDSDDFSARATAAPTEPPRFRSPQRGVEGGG